MSGAGADGQARGCAFCPKLCRHVCPVALAEGSEAATPTWKGVLIARYRRGLLPLAGAVSEAVFRCTDCGAQRAACLHRVDAPAMYHRVRVEAHAHGCLPPALERFRRRCERLGNPFSADLAPRLRRVLGRAEGATHAAPLWFEPASAAELVLLPGCTAIARTPARVAAALFVLRRVYGSGVRVLAYGGCCGAPLRAAGDEAGYVRQRRALERALEGARRVLALDPVCVRALTEWAPPGRSAAEVRVEHVLEGLARERERVAACVVAPRTEPIAYHDPCHLGRHRGVYEPPRTLLALACGGRAPVELRERREYAACCGAGGVYRKLWPGPARRIARRRLEQYAATGARRLATACPSATCHLGRERPAGEVTGVIELLAHACGWRGEETAV